MGKKKSVLPKEMKELIEKNNIDEIKKIYEKCDIDARGGYSKATALSFYKISDELISWLVEQGADINAEDNYKRTALHNQANSWCGNVKLLIKLGANVEALDYQKETPLHSAACSYKTESVRELLNHGANVNSINTMNQTPLENALIMCQNINIIEMAEISKLLIQHGSKISDSMRESVKKIGKNFEFHKEKFNKELLPQTIDALNSLYAIYNVEPIETRIVHDGVSKIKVTTTKWEEQHKELWNYLVPSQGYAGTVQGEVIRITGRLSHEIFNNGRTNWDGDYKKMLNEIKVYFRLGTQLPDSSIEEVQKIIKEINNGTDDEEISKLCEFAVEWVMLNPEPIQMSVPDYKR